MRDPLDIQISRKRGALEIVPNVGFPTVTSDFVWFHFNSLSGGFTAINVTWSAITNYGVRVSWYSRRPNLKYAVDI